MQKITPCIWFNMNAEEAIDYYISVFKNSKKNFVSYYPVDEKHPKGTVMTISFNLEGNDYLALNGGPEYKLTHAFSLMVSCKTQEEIDYYWEKLSEGGEEVQCGWLVDKFGLSWQIIPANLEQILYDSDEGKRLRKLQAIWSMKKFDLKKIEEA